MGFSGTLWFLSNVFAVAAIAALVRRSQGGRLYPTLVFGILGALSYSTSLFVWPALLVGCLLLRLSRRDFAGLSATACVLFLLSAVLYVRPEGHPDPQVRNLMLLFRYSSGYLGALFSSDSAVAFYLGLSGLLVSAAVAAAAVRRGEEFRVRAAPWIMVQCYAIANAGATAVFRSGLAAGPGESRYATLPALFWAALLMMTFLAMSADGQPGRGSRVLRWSPAGMLVLSLVVPMYGRGMDVLRGFLERAAYAPVAGQALLLGVHDDVMLNYVTYYPEEIWSVLPVLQRTRHVPFDHPSQAVLPVGSRLQPKSPEVIGYFDTLERIDDHFARACGWAFGLKETVVEVIIADETGVVLGRGVLGLPREDVARQVGAAATASGWCGYVRIEDPSEWYTAYARQAGGKTSSELIGAHKAS